MAKGDGVRRRGVPVVLGVAAAALLTACSSSSGSSSGTPTTGQPAASSTRPSTTSTTAASAVTTSSGAAPVYQVNTGTVPALGTVLVDGQGFTLYVFAPDKQSGASTCYGECAQAWPPLLLPSGVSRVPAGPGVNASLLGTTKRHDGTVQVTYDKWPLYLWVVDSAPGQATGQNVNNSGGKWYVITPEGKVITK